MHELAELECAVSDEGALRKAENRNDRGRGRRVEDESRRQCDGITAQHDLRETREPERATHAQQPLHAAVILGADEDKGEATQATRDLEVPVVPAFVGDDEILLRREEAHETAQNQLFLVAALAPVREIEGTLEPDDARLLPRLMHGIGGALAEPDLLQSPFEALP